MKKNTPIPGMLLKFIDKCPLKFFKLCRGHHLEMTVQALTWYIRTLSHENKTKNRGSSETNLYFTYPNNLLKLFYFNDLLTTRAF